MVNYNLGKIYQIVCYNTGKIYIGSTCETTLARRLTTHVNAYKQYVKGCESSSYVYSFEIFKENNYKIELIKYFPCETKAELTAEEGKCIRSMECVNKRVEGRNKKMYREDNKDKIKEQSTQYRKNNKDKIKEDGKEYYKKNKEVYKERQKLDKYVQNRKNRYLSNQDKMIQYARMHRLYKKTVKELCNIII
jgi:hypothetical protein